MLVEAVFEDGFHAAIGERLDVQGSQAGFLQPLWGVTGCQADDAETGSEALLRVWTAVDDLADKGLGVGAVLGGPVDDPGRGPL